MNGNIPHWLSRTRHVDIPAENLAAALDEEALSSISDEKREACYLALGQGPASMAGHLSRQHRSLPWHRQWICDPKKADSVKIIMFDNRRSLTAAMSTYSGFGQPCVEVAEEDLPYLLDDINEIVIGQENYNSLQLIGWRLGRVHLAMRRLRRDEVQQLLEAPPSAESACWLLNYRDRLFDRPTPINFEDLPWSVRIAEWETLPCEAIHPDGNVIRFYDKWTWLSLPDFYERYCQHVHSSDMRMLNVWKTELRIAAARAEALKKDGEDDGVVPFYWLESENGD